jgi:hypothetical protein
MMVSSHRGTIPISDPVIAMTAFRKTIGGLDPWSMPSDGVNGSYIHLHPGTKAWERRQYHKAARREAKRLIDEESATVE